MRFFTFFLLNFICICNIAFAQPCAGPGRTAQTAIEVCGTLTFHQGSVSSCTGPNLPFNGCSTLLTTSNSIWYKFHCYQSGTLGFLITPNSIGDDYDWQVMDYTGHPPGDVYNINLGISLNLSGVTGVTGCTAAGVSNVNCAGGANGTQFNRMPILVAGSDYLLIVNNYVNSTSGYDIDFVGGTAVLTNNLPPAMTNVGIVGCDPSKLKISFSKDVLCSSITPLGTEFTITTGTFVITGITSACSSGSNAVPDITLNMQNPIPAGNYRITVNDGTDGNTLLDVCQAAMPAGSFFDFTVPAIPPTSITGVSYTGCAPTILDIPLSKPVWCTSVTPTGSEFTILPGSPVITSVQSTCSSGAMFTDTLHIVLQNPLAAGNYQLVVNNGADGNTFVDTCNNSIPVGNSTPFTITTSTPPPVIQTIAFDQCHPNKLVLNFDKPVSCSSITAAGSEFSVNPGVWPISSIVSNCGPATYTQQVTLNLLNPLTAGNFNVKISGGTDGNTISDTCFSYVIAGYTKAFTATQAPLPKFDSLQFDKCSPNVVKVFYSHAIQCSSVSADGSDFTLTGPSSVTITSATTDVTCAQGYTNWILLQLSQPITVFGNYTLHNGIGTDANGIIDTCNAKQNTAETISMNVFGKPLPAYTSQVNWGCLQDTILLSHPGGNGINSWTWIFSDGSTLYGQSVSHIFPVATPSIDIKLIVSNGSCSDSVTTTVVLGNVFKAGFTNTPKDTTCLGNPVSFTDTSRGAITNYLWQFGDATQFNGQNPPPHIYPAINAYTIQLIVTDNHGCKDTARHNLVISNLPIIDFTGLASQYCVGNKIFLSRQPYPDFLSYTWDNGDGKIFQNNVHVEFSYPAEGIYTITLSGVHKYCGPTQRSKTVPVYAVPVVNLGRDTVLCPDTRISIGVSPVLGYTYLWNTGATSNVIYSDIFTRSYLLKVDNHGCNASDDLFIKVLPACLIRVPGAFTPNGDGLNDKLKALNADLARNFSFKVYNRLGQLIYSTTIPTEGWDGIYKGVQAETGTYVWQLRYNDPATGKAVFTKGTSILLR
jgi:gliding motility-associated-like protein